MLNKRGTIFPVEMSIKYGQGKLTFLVVRPLRETDLDPDGKFVNAAYGKLPEDGTWPHPDVLLVRRGKLTVDDFVFSLSGVVPARLQSEWGMRPFWFVKDLENLPYAGWYCKVLHRAGLDKPTVHRTHDGFPFVMFPYKNSASPRAHAFLAISPKLVGLFSHTGVETASVSKGGGEYTGGRGLGEALVLWNRFLLMLLKGDIRVGDHIDGNIFMQIEENLDPLSARKNIDKAFDVFKGSLSPPMLRLWHVVRTQTHLTDANIMAVMFFWFRMVFLNLEEDREAWDKRLLPAPM